MTGNLKNRKYRRFQFSTKALILAFVVMSIAVGIVARLETTRRREDAAIKYLRANGIGLGVTDNSTTRMQRLLQPESARKTTVLAFPAGVQPDLSLNEKLASALADDEKSTEISRRILELPAVEQVWLQRFKLNAVIWDALSDLRELKRFQLHDSVIDKSTVARIQHVDCNELYIDNCSLENDVTLIDVIEAAGTSKTTLFGCHFKEFQLNNSEANCNVRELSITGGRYSDKLVSCISSCTSIEELRIAGWGLTPASLDVLADMDSLKKLTIVRSDFTDEMLNELRSARPDTEVLHSTALD